MSRQPDAAGAAWRDETPAGVAESDSRVAVLLDRLAAERPDDVFLVHDDGDWSFSSLRDHAVALAAGLQSLGIGKGDAVAVISGNTPQAMITWFATTYLGAIEVPVNVALRGEMLEHVLNDSGATLAIVDIESFQILMDAPIQLRHLAKIVVITPDGEADGQHGKRQDTPRRETLTFYDWSALGHERALAPTDVQYFDSAAVIYTSGTTGPAKGVVISHRQQIHIGMLVGRAMEYRRDDVALNYLPSFHVANRFVTLAALIAGAQVVLKPRFSMSEFWNWVHVHGVTVLTAVGGVSEMLYNQPPSDVERSSLRAVYSVPGPREWSSFEARFGVQALSAYGQTENSLVIASRLGEVPPTGAMGRAVDDFEVKIFDENDVEVPDGTPGEIVLRPRVAHVVTVGYLNRPDATAACMRNLWWHTGDRGVRDSAGYFYFLDRVHDAMRSRGENVSSFEVERAALAHPLVQEAAAVGIPSPLGDQDIMLVAVLRDGAALSHRELFDHCVQVLPFFAVPRFIEFREALPKTPTEKVRKVDLRADAVDGPSAAVWDCSQFGIRIGRDGVRETSDA